MSEEKSIEPSGVNEKILLFNEAFNITLNAYNFDNTPTVSITSSAENIATVSNIEFTKVKDAISTLSFKINSLEVEGSANITITVTDDDYTYEEIIAVEVYETMPVSYSVVPVEGSLYGFEMNADGYYESNNQGIDNSVALCKVIIENPVGANVYFDCINSSEVSWDQGMISKLNTELFSNDSTSNTMHVFNSSSPGIQTVDAGCVEGFFYVKYKKDGSNGYDKDSLQFKVRFEF